MKLSDLQDLIDRLSNEYVKDTEIEFSMEDSPENRRLSLSHVNHFQETTTPVAVEPRPKNTPPRRGEDKTMVNTIFIVFRE